MDPKATAQEHFTEIGSQLVDLSHCIHAHPELGFEEERALAWLAELLDEADFAVERGRCKTSCADSTTVLPRSNLVEWRRIQWRKMTLQ